MTKTISALLCLIICVKLCAQTKKTDLQSLSIWSFKNRKAALSNADGKKAVYLDEGEGDGLMILKDYQFSNGIIAFDVKGRNVVGRSFIGLAFHIQNDSTFDCIYFRPFNFQNPDTIRRGRAVQYISSPHFGWEKLRNEHPGKYENPISPVPDPDGWFHVRVEVAGRNVKVFVNNNQASTLVVEKLTNITSGGIGLWVGNGSDGTFANLSIISRK